MMVANCDYFAVILILLVAVDRIDEAHEAAILEDKRNGNGITYLFLLST